MFRRRQNQHTNESAARLGARDNLLLGIAQFTVGVFTGNFGFMTEAGHQVADSASLKAKADAMKPGCPPHRASRLRKAGASVLVAGGVVGISGGAIHIAQGTTEAHGALEIGAALTGAAVNTIVAKRSHGAHHEHDDHDHVHSHGIGAALDTKVHMFTDVGTGFAYAAGLMLESRIPGITNPILIASGVAIGSAGIHTLARIRRDDGHHNQPHTEAHQH